MKNVRNIIKIAILLYLSVSCGSSEDSDSKDSAADTSIYQGTWSLACASSGTDSGSYVFDGSNFTYKTSHFNGESTSCEAANKDFDAEVTGTYKIGADIEGVEGAKAIDITFVTYTMTPTSEDAVSFFNDESGCASGEWELDTKKDLTTLDCDMFGDTAKGTIVYDIIKVNSDKLTLGDSEDDATDGTTEAKRPTALESDSYTKE
ncbi:MAG: hypothetical protein R3B45_01165 [Bdellovibrionota bacterium]